MCDYIDWVSINQEPVWSVALIRLIRSPAVPRQILRMGNLFAETMITVIKVMP